MINNCTQQSSNSVDNIIWSCAIGSVWHVYKTGIECIPAVKPVSSSHASSSITARYYIPLRSVKCSAFVGGSFEVSIVWLLTNVCTADVRICYFVMTLSSADSLISLLHYFCTRYNLTCDTNNYLNDVCYLAIISCLCPKCPWCVSSQCQVAQTALNVHVTVRECVST